MKRKPMRSAPPAFAKCCFILPEMRQKIVGLLQSSVCKVQVSLLLDWPFGLIVL